MTISLEAQEIVDILYKAYGSGSGIVFGIDSPKVVGVIVQFTIDRFKDKCRVILNDTNLSGDDRVEMVKDIIQGDGNDIQEMEDKLK